MTDKERIEKLEGEISDLKKEIAVLRSLLPQPWWTGPTTYPVYPQPTIPDPAPWNPPYVQPWKTYRLEPLQPGYYEVICKTG